MSYGNADKVRYQFGNHDFGAAAGVKVYHIQGPVGRAGKLRNIGVDVTEATVFATTLGKVQVGTGAEDDTYGVLNIATAVTDDTVFDKADDTDAIVAADIAADAVVFITLVEGTGAGLAGQGIPFVEIDWM